jgi:SAM-dependent methyltransferase
MASIIYKNSKIYDIFIHLLRGNFAERRVTIISEMIGQNKKVIDLGCGSSNLAKYLNKSCLYTGIDMNPNFVNESKKKGLNVILGDMFDQKNYSECDVVVAADIIHHIHKKRNDLINLSKKFGKRMIIAEEYYSNFSLRWLKMCRKGLMLKFFNLFFDFDGINDPKDMKYYSRESLLSWLSEKGFVIKQEIGNYVFAEMNPN